MSTQLLILLVAILVAIVVVVWRYLQSRDMKEWYRSEANRLREHLRELQERQIATVELETFEPESLVRQTVVVNTRDGRTIRGVLMSEHSDRVTLVEAFYLAGSGEHQLAGQTHVPRSNISFIQEVVLTTEVVAYEEAEE